MEPISDQCSMDVSYQCVMLVFFGVWSSLLSKELLSKYAIIVRLLIFIVDLYLRFTKDWHSMPGNTWANHCLTFNFSYWAIFDSYPDDIFWSLDRPLYKENDQVDWHILTFDVIDQEVNAYHWFMFLSHRHSMLIFLVTIICSISLKSKRTHD